MLILFKLDNSVTSERDHARVQMHFVLPAPVASKIYKLNAMFVRRGISCLQR
jgi:hypothetical protein